MSGIHVTYDILVILMWLVPLAQVWTRLGNCSNWEQKHDDREPKLWKKYSSFKWIFIDKSYSKFIISPTLGLKLMN
jgi:hypothetical protein